MIIDFHSHCYPDKIAARTIAALARATQGLLQPVGDGTLKNHLDHLDSGGIDKAVMSPVATKPAQFDPILKTALAIKDGALGERARRKIVPFASVHPRDPLAMEHLEQVASSGIRGIKLHPYYQNFSLDDPSIFPLFGKIRDLGLVVLSHAGYDIGFPGRRDACSAREIEILLKNVPGLKFVAAHLGGCGGFPPHATDALAELGCWIDTSVLSRDWHKDEQMRLLRSWPRDRILFGTDFPWVHYREAVSWVESIRDPADLELVFHLNAERLLGL